MKRSALTYAAFWFGVYLGLEYVEGRRRRAEIERELAAVELIAAGYESAIDQLLAVLERREPVVSENEATGAAERPCDGSGQVLTFDQEPAAEREDDGE